MGKDLPLQTVDAESIGLMIFRGEGPKRFRVALEAAVRDPSASRAWYLQVVGTLAKTTRVETAAISGLWWGGVDSPDDLAQVRATLGGASFHRCALGS